MTEGRAKDEPLSSQSERPPTAVVRTALFHQAPLLAGFQRDLMQALYRLFVAFREFVRLVVGGKRPPFFVLTG